MIKEMLFPALMSASVLGPSACAEPKSVADTAELDTGESLDPLGSLEGAMSYVRNSCGWLSQEWPGQEPTVNCGPASLVMVGSCVNGTEPSGDELVALLDHMDENAETTGYNGSREDYSGSFTPGSVLIATMESYYDGVDAILVGDGFGDRDFGENYGNAVALSDLLRDVKSGYPPVILTASQGYWPTGDEMVADGSPHFMVLMGATLEEEGTWSVVLHDPNPYFSEYGAFHAYTLDSFVNAWRQHAAIRFFPKP